MAFTNIGPDLTLPPGTALAAGSSAVYLGGAQLPAALVTLGVNAALIFYSTTGADAAAVDYYFVAHDPGPRAGGGGSVSSGSGQLLVGMVKAGAVSSVYSCSPDGLFLAALEVDVTVSNAGGTVRFLRDGFGTIESVSVSGLGDAPVVKAVNSSIDTLFSETFTGTVGGVANTVITNAYRMSVDRILYLQVNGNFPTAPATLNINLGTTTGLPSFPAAWGVPASFYLPLTWDNGAFSNTQITAARFIGSLTTYAIAGGGANPNLMKRFQLDVAIPCAKP